MVFEKASFKLSEKLFRDIASYIDANYVDACYGAVSEKRSGIFRRREMDGCRRTAAPEECLPCAPMAEDKAASLEEMLRQADASFTETLLKLIDRTGKKDSEIYKKANISKQLFSKIRNNPAYKPTKPTAIALALALELDLAETNDLIGRAGFTLSNSSKFDLIIRYFIQQRNYNVVEINMALYEFDQMLLS